MKILITAPGEFMGDDLQVGCHYNAEPAEEGTDAQRRAFFALVREYWVSGCHSSNVRNYGDFCEYVKYFLGAGGEEFTNFVNEDGTPCPQGRPDYRVRSWTTYTKRERSEAIKNLIAEMHQAQVQTRRFYEILQGLEENDVKRMGG